MSTVQFPSNSNFKASSNVAPITGSPGLNPTPTQPARREVKPVVKAPVTVLKPSWKSRLTSAFIGSEKGTVGNYIVEDVLIPGVKNTFVQVVYTIFDGIANGFEMLLFGDKARGQRRGFPQRTNQGPGTYHYNYSGIASTAGGYTREMPHTTPLMGRSVYDKCSGIAFASRKDAEEVLFNIADLIQDYGSATVADFLESANERHEYTDRHYGWTTETGVPGANILRTPDGKFIIDMPRPVPLENVC